MRRARLVGEQLVAQGRPDLHLAHPGVGLGLPHAEPAAREIDVAPAQLEEFPDPEAREAERCEQRPPGDVPAVRAGLGVESAGGVEQRGDLAGRSR